MKLTGIVLLPLFFHLIAVMTATQVRRSASHVACSRTNLMTTITFQQPFYGIVYAKGYSQDCQVDGNGTKIIHFQSPVHKCGIKITDEKELYQFELHLYVQYDKNIQQSQDDRILVRCAPQEILLHGGMGRRNDEGIDKTPNLKNLHGDSRIQVKPMDNHHFAESTVDSIECWMDILKGRIPYLKTIDGYVNIGEDITVLVKIKKMTGVDSRLSKCFAHDRSLTAKFDLTDDDGCTLDKTIMPNFKEIVHDNGNSKIIYTTFPAFKFPDRSNLHIQCTVVVCNTTCPKFDCDTRPSSPQAITTELVTRPLVKRAAKMQQPLTTKKQTNLMNIVRRRPGNGTAYEKTPLKAVPRDKILSQVGLSSVVDVSEDLGDVFYKESGVLGEFFGDEAVSCLTSPVVIVCLILLSSSFLASLFVAIFMGLKVQTFRRRLLVFESFPPSTTSSVRNCYHPYYKNDLHDFSYGRMVDLTVGK